MARFVASVPLGRLLASRASAYPEIVKGFATSLATPPAQKISRATTLAVPAPTTLVRSIDMRIYQFFMSETFTGIAAVNTRLCWALSESRRWQSVRTGDRSVHFLLGGNLE